MNRKMTPIYLDHRDNRYKIILGEFSEKSEADTSRLNVLPFSNEPCIKRHLEENEPFSKRIN